MTTTFASLGVSQDLVDALAEKGITEPFAIQELAIPDGLKGRDVLGKAKTGSGKTLAFGIPLLERIHKAEPKHPHAIVLVPTRELASQVAEELAPLGRARGLVVEAMYGGTSVPGNIEALERGVDVLVSTPGRTVDLIEREALILDNVEVAVLDEADRMVDMGFFPPVTWILRRVNPDHQTLLFSATLDGTVGTLANQYLNNPAEHEVEGSEPTVDTMLHRWFKVHSADKVKVCASICQGGSRVLVFCNTKRMADRLTANLIDEGVQARAIHGDLPQKAREQALKAFSDGRAPALVATDVAARGLDINELDIVVHYDPPDDHKTYLHRSGRTARAGADGVAVTLFLYNEEMKVRALMRALGLSGQPMAEIFSNNPGLANLPNFDGASEDSKAS